MCVCVFACVRVPFSLAGIARRIPPVRNGAMLIFSVQLRLHEVLVVQLRLHEVLTVGRGGTRL